MSGGSDSDWGTLAEFSDDLATAWDAFARLPEPGANALLDALCASKSIDIPALMRLGARLADDDVIAFASPGGIQFRHLVTDKRWNYLGSEFKRLKIVPASQSDGPSERVLVAEGWTDAAKLTNLYPECDVAVLPAGARRFTFAFAEQLEPYRWVGVATDADDAGEAGAAKIAELVVNAVRFAPPSGTDWCEFDGESPPLPEPPPRRASLLGRQAVDLAQIMEDGPPEIEFLPTRRLGPGLFPRGDVFSLVGHKKTGKTLAALLASSDLIAQGIPTLYLDLENGTNRAARRLLTLGAEPADVRAHFTYSPFPRLPKLDALCDEFERIAEDLPGAFVILDSLRGFMTRYDLESDRAEQIEKLLGPIMEAVQGLPLEIRPTVCVLDHPNRQTRSGDMYAAGGSQAKAAGVSYTYWWDCLSEFSESTQGTVKIVPKDDRDGTLPDWRMYRIGGQGHGAPLHFEQVDEDDAQAEDAQRYMSDTDRLALKLAHVVHEHGETIKRAELADSLGVPANSTLDDARAKANANNWIVNERGGCRPGTLSPPPLLDGRAAEEPRL